MTTNFTLPPALFIGRDEDHAVDTILFDGIFLNDRWLGGRPEGKLTGATGPEQPICQLKISHWRRP